MSDTAGNREARFGTTPKLVSLTVAALLIPLIIVWSALVGLSQVNAAHDTSSAIHVAQRYQQDADQLHDAIHSVVLRAVLSGLTKDTSARASISSDLSTDVNEINADVNQIKVHSLDADVKRVVADLTSYINDAQRLVPLAFTDPMAARADLPVFEAAFQRLAVAQAALTDAISAAAGRSDGRAEKAETRAKLSVIAAASVTGLLMLLLGFVLLRMAHANSRLVDRLRTNAAERAAASARLASAQQLAHMGSWEAEPGNHHARASDELFRIIGVEPGSHRVALDDYWQLVHPDDRERTRESHAEALRTGSTVETQHRLVRPDGQVRDIRSRVTATPGEAGMVLSGVVHDVTEQRAVERLKDEFVSVISHELRTPLTSIRGALGLLAGGALGPLSPKAQRMTDIALGSSERLVRLINDILDVERMAAGKLTMKPASWPARDLLDAAVSEMLAMATDAGVRLAVREVAGSVWADRDRIAQALTNLISNAIKFSPRDTEISLSALPRDGSVLFRIADQGRGIPSDQLDKVFDRFAQVDASDAREKGGTGLGLAICRGIVEQHGGRIWAEQVPTGGTAFLFTVPLAEAQAAPSQARAKPVAAGADGRGPALICDDDPDVVDVLATMLETHGHPSLRAHGGREAVELAQQHHPSVIVLDLVMPGMSGWDTLTELRAHDATKHIPVVILSALNPDEAHTTEVSEWVTKPVDLDALLRALRHALHEDDPATVLVIEDDAALAQVLAAMFERHGVRTLTAGTGRQAVELSEVDPPDLVVLDLGLPDIDGFTVVDALRKNARVSHAPLVVYSGTDLAEGDRRRLRLGETRFLAKGRVTPEEFERQVLTLLDKLGAHR